MREMAEVAKVVYPARCPFCGSEGTTLMDLTDGTGMAWVKCLSCRAEGPKRESVAEAVAAWNGTAAVVADRLDRALSGNTENAVDEFFRMTKEGCRPAEAGDVLPFAARDFPPPTMEFHFTEAGMEAFRKRALEPPDAEPADMEGVRRRFDELEAKLSTYFATAEAAAIEAKKAGWNEAVDNIARTIKAANNQGEGNPLIERLGAAILELKQ